MLQEVVCVLKVNANTVKLYPERWRRHPPKAAGRMRAEMRVRVRMMTRGSRWGGTEGTSRGRRNPTPGQNTGPSSGKYSTIISLSARKKKISIFDALVNNNWHQLTAPIATMRHVPVWVEAILQERGTTFPETSAWSFWSCCSSDLERKRRYGVFWWAT